MSLVETVVRIPANCNVQSAVKEKIMAITHGHSSTRPSLASLPLIQALEENWWLVLLRGIAAIALGVLAFAWPGVTLLTLTFLFGVYALTDGLLALWAAISGNGVVVSSRWWLALAGLVGIAAGIVTFVAPGITTRMLLLLIASWALVEGIAQIIGAIQLRKEIKGEWLLFLNGLVSVAFGVLLIVRPVTGVLALIGLIGAYAIIVGCSYIWLAFWLKHHRHPV